MDTCTSAKEIPFIFSLPSTTPTRNFFAFFRAKTVITGPTCRELSWRRMSARPNNSATPASRSGPDGTFHLVWTTGWHDSKGFGYASSKDLIHWSDQQFIPVMTNEPTTVNVWAPELFYDATRQTIHHRLGLDDSRPVPGPDWNRTRTITACISPRRRDFKTFSPHEIISRSGIQRDRCDSSSRTAIVMF